MLQMVLWVLLALAVLWLLNWAARQLITLPGRYRAADQRAEKSRLAVIAEAQRWAEEQENQTRQ